MRKVILYLSILVGTSAQILAQINSSSPARPFNSNTGYAYGIMPTNLPSGGTYGKSSDAADAYNSWKSKYVVACGSAYRVLFDDKSSTVSEGIAYGMLLSAYAGDKSLFDGLWKFYRDNSNGNGVMNWKIGGCSGATGQNGATDAELDAAMALIVAEEQWPSASSPYDYIAEARFLIGKIKQFEIHNSSKQTINGDAWGMSNGCRNPGYFAPAYYRQYAIAVPGDASFWNSVADVSDAYLIKNRHATTGLISNWADPNAVSNSCNGPDEYGYDACRNPWRMGVDVLWHGASSAKAGNDICNKIASWSNGNVGAFKGPLKQDGSPSGTAYASGTFVPTFAVGVMGAASSHQSLLNSSYTASKNIAMQYENYFGETLRAVMLFVMTGNFWKPGASIPPTSVVTVGLTTPANGTSFTQGSAVNLSATASSTNGASITNVEFIIDGTSVGSDNSSPYSYSTSTLSVGSHTISVKGTDSNGKTATTSNISITITAIQTSVVSVSLTAPSNNASFTQGSAVNFTATASSTNGASITNVEFFVDGTSVGSDNSSPYSFSSTTLSVGTHKLTAKATDSNAKTATSSEISITITPPSTSVVTVNLTAPTATDFNQGTAVDLSATASSTNNASIVKVEFYVDNNLVNTDNSSPYSFTISNLAVGQHTVYAKAYDSNNQSASTTSKTINIKSTPITDAPDVETYKAASTVVIDGVMDATWTNAPAETNSKEIIAAISNSADLSGSFRTLWDDQYFYIFAEIKDDAKMNDNGSNEPYNDDAVEIFFDVNNDKATSYDNNDVQYTFRWNDNTIYANPSGRSTANIQFKMLGTADGYTFEARVPWSTLTGSPTTGKQIGFDFQINDDDNGAGRDGKLSWAASSDDAWQNPSLIGIGILKGPVPTGLEDLFEGGAVKVYPNPFQSTIYLEGLKEQVEYVIMDLNGKTLQTGLAKGKIDLEVEAGLYNLMLKPKGNNQYHHIKLVKTQ